MIYLKSNYTLNISRITTKVKKAGSPFMVTRKSVGGMGVFFLLMPPGPDLVYKESVYGVQPRNNVSLISYSNNVAPGQAWPRPGL